MSKKNSWVIDWANKLSTGTKVMAMNPSGLTRNSRVWHLVTTGYLRSIGYSTPTYRKDSWEIEWGKRSGKLVWARNKLSKMPSARKWHFVDFHTLERAGIKWKCANERTGRIIAAGGYVILSRNGMSEDDVLLAEKHGLLVKGSKKYVMEHRLVALKKYGYVPEVVRHSNGVKGDNRPENLLAGTSQENTMDHDLARRMAMFWRDRYNALSKKTGDSVDLREKPRRYDAV